MQPIGLRRSEFQAIAGELKVKKIARRVERSARLLRLKYVGAVIPPIGCIRRERPSTPSAPYSLTRPVVPPDGSFIFGADFRKPLRTPTPCRLAARRAPSICGGALIFSCVFQTETAEARSRNAAMLPRGLTVDRANYCGFL